MLYVLSSSMVQIKRAQTFKYEDSSRIVISVLKQSIADFKFIKYTLSPNTFMNERCSLILSKRTLIINDKLLFMSDKKLPTK